MNRLKLDLWIKFIIRLIDNNAVKQATNEEKIDLDKFIFRSELLIKSIPLNTIEARIIGIDNSIEKIAAEDLSKPKNLAPEIVTPALLAPGIKANI